MHKYTSFDTLLVSWISMYNIYTLIAMYNMKVQVYFYIAMFTSHQSNLQ